MLRLKSLRARPLITNAASFTALHHSGPLARPPIRHAETTPRSLGLWLFVLGCSNLSSDYLKAGQLRRPCLIELAWPCATPSFVHRDECTERQAPVVIVTKITACPAYCPETGGVGVLRKHTGAYIRETRSPGCPALWPVVIS